MIKIDLNAYIEEVRDFSKMAGDLIDRTSQTDLGNIATSLEAHLTRTTEFPWKTPNRIKTVPSNLYDGLNKAMPPLRLSFGFSSTLKPNLNKRNKIQDWTIKQMSCNMKLLAEDETTLGDFHVDLKNKDQLGPTIHFQVAERRGPGGFKVGIPRMPIGVVLPTDCLDFALFEVFPRQWPQKQTEYYRTNFLIQRQQHRIEEVFRKLQDGWKGVKSRTPVSYLQNHTFTELCF